MRPVRTGVQWTSRRSSLSPKALALTVMGALILTVAAWTAPAAAATDYLLMSRSELLARPTSGTAWNNLKSVANGSLGSPDLCDQDADHHLRTLAAALVYARTGTASYATKARGGVMAAIKTQKVGCGNAVLALGRQLTAYVLAADFADLSGTDDTTFKAWLKAIRTKDIGGHSTWDSLYTTHRISANNWGAHAGASFIAASLYIGDTANVGYAAVVTQGFLGDRAKYAKFAHNLDSQDMSWSCASSASSAAPTNGTCTKSGVNVDGAFIADISRGGSVKSPPGEDGVKYQLESLQGVGLQVELLYQNGYTQAWNWSNKALKRAANVVTRSKSAGGTGWNETNASKQMPWLFNKRYGTTIPTASSGMGRSIGFTDWLWGGGGGGGTPAPTPKPTPKPPSGDAPVVSAPWLRLSTTSSVPASGVPVVMGWALKSSDDPLQRYQLQVRVDSGSYVSKSLSSATARYYRMTFSPKHDYTIRVRAVDRAGRVGAWTTTSRKHAGTISDGSASLRWSGSWKLASGSSYLASKAHWTNSKGPSVSLGFSGSSIAWVGPVGPTRGKAQVFIDGKYVVTVNLYASKFSARRILFATAVPQGSHKITVKALGTSGRPTVAVDAFFVVRPG
jgi:hypothetical protein